MAHERAKIHLVVLQATSLCNLNCRYCYIPDRMNAAIMDDNTVENAIARILDSSLIGSSVTLLWHAGEPLLAGQAFYERASNLVRTYNTRRIRVRQAIQTNGTLIDTNWCKFFTKEEFNIGVSIDGPKFLHDRQRPNWSGRGSHQHVMRGVELLKAHGVPFGALCVLTAETLKYPDEMYQFFCSNGFDWLGLNIEEIEGVHRHSSLASSGILERRMDERYRRFIGRLFDLWRQNPKCLVIREFRDMLALIQMKRDNPNHQRRPDETKPFNTITIHRDGSITTNSPEFASSRDSRFSNFVFGNIDEIPIRKVTQNTSFKCFQRAVRKSVRECKESCEYFDLCGGGYLSNKHAEHGRVESTETLTCRLHRQAVASVILDKLTRIPRNQATD